MTAPENDRDFAAAVRRRFERAKSARGNWENAWRDCYEFSLPPAQPRRAGLEPGSGPAPASGRLFDGTAPDAVEQLAASLLTRLTPPWSRWFGLAAGRDLSPEERQKVGPELEAIAEALQTHFDRSNFAVEIHQCYLDLATAGTACLLFEEAAIGAESAFRFAAVPLADVWLEESAEGRIDTVFRRSSLAGEAFRRRFPDAALEPDIARRIDAGEDVQVELVEAVLPDGEDRYRYVALCDGGTAPAAGEDAPLAEGRFQRSPFIAFRWMKAPGEAYGRSPVMKALPDIRTANKVVELILKNASIAATGIWQAEDDGILNPANIKLVPGTIIPKAVGSAGLTPLEAPGRFDVSQLVLDDLRARIRHALMADALGQVDSPRMTATEVLERSADVIVCDDVEVPGNSDTPAKRAALRDKLGEIEFVLVPDGAQLYLGTPHTYYSIYADKPRAETGEARPFLDGFARKAFPALTGKSHRNSAWSDRFPPSVLKAKRAAAPRKFASQMMLMPTAPEACRLDPGKLLRYSAEPEYREAQGRGSLWLEGRKLASMRVWWDPAYGRTAKASRNVIAAVYQDEAGGYWLHRVAYFAADPELAEAAPEEHPEAEQLCRAAARLAMELGAPAITVEDNGLGKFVPGLLRKALAKIGCAAAVLAHAARVPKGERILAAFDVTLAAGLLHAHDSVCDGPFVEEMNEWVPEGKSGIRDDALDAVAGAIMAEPTRLGPFPRPPAPPGRRQPGAWRQAGTVHVAETDFTP